MNEIKLWVRLSLIYMVIKVVTMFSQIWDKREILWEKASLFNVYDLTVIACLGLVILFLGPKQKRNYHWELPFHVLFLLFFIRYVMPYIGFRWHEWSTAYGLASFALILFSLEIIFALWYVGFSWYFDARGSYITKRR